MKLIAFDETVKGGGAIDTKTVRNIVYAKIQYTLDIYNFFVAIVAAVYNYFGRGKLFYEVGFVVDGYFEAEGLLEDV